MSKIVQAVNSMIFNRNSIFPVYPGTLNASEIFFIYKDKYKWSIVKNNFDDYLLFYYPGSINLEFLSEIKDWNNFNEMVRYSANEIGTTEAISSFAELYSIVKEKVYGIDGILDDIIDDMITI